MNKKILSSALTIVLYAALSCFGQEFTPDEEYNPYEDMEQMQLKAEVPLEQQKELTVSFSTTVLNLDPHTSAYAQEAQILNSLYEGLFCYGPQMANPVNCLCTEYRTSRDKLYWTFTLRSDAKFSDGTPITSQHVKDSWLHLIATPKAYYSSFLDIIEGAKEYRLGTGSAEDVGIYARDPHTLSVQLVNPVSHLPKILCHHAFSVIDIEKENYSGPYKLVEQKADKVILEKNEYYFDKKNILIPKITIIQTENPEEASFLFNTGKVQWIDGECDTNKLLDKNAIKLERSFGTTFFFFKEGNSPYLTEKVRQALMEATPWELLRNDSFFKASTFVYPLAGYTPPAPLDYTDFDHAKNLMIEAKKELGLTEKDVIDLSIFIHEGTYIYQQAKMIKHAWARVGVNLKIDVYRGSGYYNQISSSKADLFTYTWVGDFYDPITFLELFKGDSNLNESNWKNEKYDELINKANITMDPFNRYNLLSEAEDILLSSGMILPINFSLGINIVNTEELGGWSDSPLNIHPYKYLFFKEVKSTSSFGIVALK
ncbi:MAG: peptide ABC transporter substrate-binding protein [Treponema sp.]|uniref:peptide ABC transporter substrate-binding protein n=1 Tax=Treponema sp. TaxID=166 RepID=UPI001D29F020|nr:peptide ABC transporter substrate-binding protein [Treponema sp.]MBS7310382.1 peptide ABC transporter substrate-binding protein [Treponema sp.]MCI5695708.1 peptide ABC transporter substrate-binding protein [Spirochaetia bacterium]MDY5886525.1 peptide ABC transporter substrate-binding protein [Treponema sp.]